MSELREGNLIEKSKRLVWAQFNNYTAGELRLLETYLSRINPRDPESSRIQFTLAEYSALMGLPQLRAEQVKPYLKHFVETSVTIPIDPENRKRTQFSVFPLFCRGTCAYDENLRQYIITLSCNPELKDVFFNLAESRYIRYRLRYTKDMKSQYSIRLYSMLRDWQPHGSYSTQVSQLREDLEAMEKSYISFNEFRKWVLDPAVAEINKLSDLKVSYTKIKKGRSITDICFKISLKPTQKTIDAQARELSDEHPGEWYAEVLGRELSPAQALTLAQLVKNKITELHPDIPADQHDQAAKDVLQRAYKALLLPPEKDVPNPAGYLWTVLNNGAAIDDYLPNTYGKGLF